MPRFFSRREFWLYLAAGALIGCAYVWIDIDVLDESIQAGGALSAMHEMFDTVFPILSGVSIALGIFFLRQISRLNRRLSLKKERLEKDLLFSTLISQMLHEIQSPIHNISAVFEDSENNLNQTKIGIVRRNLERLTELKKQYGEHGSVLENLDPQQPVPLRRWLGTLVEDKFKAHLQELRIRYQADVESVSVKIHPVLLEQVMLSLFSNAFEALEKVPVEKRELFLRANAIGDHNHCVEISLKNRDSYFPEEMLRMQGKRMASSRHGLGLGLLLIHRMIEQVGGSLHLENLPDGAVATVTLPGERG